MRQNTRGTGELLTFLKGDSHSFEVSTTVDTTRSSLTRSSSIADDKLLAVANRTHEISGISGPISDPLILRSDNRRYKFTGVQQTGPNEAIAQNMSVQKL